MTEEGVIKFKLNWQRSAPLEMTEKICLAREELYSQGLIGIGTDGIGYGNVSCRRGSGFLITGSQTGGTRQLTAEHIAFVTSYSFTENRIDCRGPVKASSESLSHAALYSCDPKVMAVAHVHSSGLWHSAIDQLPTTDRKIPYGTPQMADEIIRLYRNSDLPESKVLIMGGHQDGIISIGSTLDECLTALFEVCDRYRA